MVVSLNSLLQVNTCINSSFLPPAYSRVAQYNLPLELCCQTTDNDTECLNLYLHSWRESCRWKPYWPQWCVQDWIEARPDRCLCTDWSESLLASDSLSRHYNHHWQTNEEGQMSQGLISTHLAQMGNNMVTPTTWQIKAVNKCQDLHAVLCWESTGGSVSAVESVLQVNTSLSNQIVPSHHVVVIDQHV